LVTGEKGCSSASIDSIKMPQGTVWIQANDRCLSRDVGI
jgi:hypothetical protein